MSRKAKVNTRTTSASQLFRGVPAVLLPQVSAKAGSGAVGDRFEIRTDGPRNLAAFPFDYRNPFPLRAWGNAIGKRGNIAEWPLRNEKVADFNYYPNDHVALGLPDGPECARLDPMGGVRVLSGAWGIGTGATGACPDYRLRHLRDGWVPIVEADTTRPDGLAFRGTWFACEIAGTSAVLYPLDNNHCYAWEGIDHPRGRNLFIVARHAIRNDGPARQSLDLRLSFAQDGALCAGAFYMTPHWMPALHNLNFSQMNRTTGRLTGTVAGQPALLGVLRSTALRFAPTHHTCAYEAASGQIGARRENPADRHCAYEPFFLDKSPKHPAKMVLGAKTTLAPGETVTVEWIIPLFLAPLTDAPLLARCSTAEREAVTARFWKRHRSRGMRLLIPEDKVRNAWYQALNNLDICSVKLGRSIFPTPGPSGGHHIFYARDSVDLIYGIALSGDIERARRMIDHYQFNGIGQEEAAMLLWLMGAFLDLTGDDAWARSMFHFVRRCAARLINDWTVNRNDPTGLLSEHFLCDNELAYGHFVSYHLYAVAGLKTAVRIARLSGEQDRAEEWESFRQRFTDRVTTRLAELAKRTGGVITPTFEGFEAKPAEMEIAGANPPRTRPRTGSYGVRGGVDWHNIALAFPTGVFAADDPIVGSSLTRWRHTYVEGVFPYAFDSDYGMLHNYNGINLSETWLRRGDWAEALRDLYGVLLHTSSTHASAEVIDSCLRLDHNCTPHNWFSGKLVRFVRDMLVYEGTDRRLHLLGGLSPAWMKPGLRVGVERAPTSLGELSFVASMSSTGFTLSIDWKPRPDVKGLALHLPPFLHDAQVRCNGKTIRLREGASPLPVGTKAVDVTWPRQSLPALSFDAVVSAYLSDHAQRVAGMRPPISPEANADAHDDPIGKSSSDAFVKAAAPH